MGKIFGFLKRGFWRLVRNQLVKGSAVLFLGSLLGNFANYLFHLVMGRMLPPSDYGALEAIVSLTYILAIPLVALNLMVVRKVASLRGSGREEEISPFYQVITRNLLFWGAFLGFLLILSGGFLKNFLHLSSVLPIFIIIFQSFLGIFQIVNSSFVNAFLKFFQFSVIGVVQAVSKLLLAIWLVGRGWSILGGSYSYLGGTILAWGVSIYYLKGILRKSGKITKVNFPGLFREILPFTILSFAFTCLYTNDVILARHFLPSREAGFYAALAVLGKIIPSACGPVILAMFPMISSRRAARGTYRRLFLLSLVLVFVVCLGIGLVYLFFPGLMVGILFGPAYLEAAKDLKIFSLFLGFYSLSALVANFFLSIGKNKTVIIPLVACLVQAVSILFFHQNLRQIAWISALICGGLFVMLMIRYFRQDTEEKSELSVKINSKE